jgi:hypothetical protein
VIEVFELIKLKKYQVLSHVLMRIESYVVLDCFAIPLAKDRVIFTIHDAVVCLEEDEEEVRQLFEQTIEKVVGFRPTIK